MKLDFDARCDLVLDLGDAAVGAEAELGRGADHQGKDDAGGELDTVEDALQILLVILPTFPEFLLHLSPQFVEIRLFATFAV